MSVLSLVFPAFVLEYSKKDIDFINTHLTEINKLILLSNNFDDITDINSLINNADEKFDELNTQYISYIVSCYISDLIKKKKIYPEYISSYSMGIYSALYYLESISFTDGLLLIKNAYNLAVKSYNNIRFGMASITGLEKNDILEIINNNSNSIEIVNKNNNLSYVLSGKYEDLTNIIHTAKEEGALSTKILPIKTPYHSKYMKNAGDKFDNFLKKINIKNPQNKYISSIDQREILSKNEVKKELKKNLYQALNWFDTMNFLIKNGTINFFECGLGKNLTKISKFIEGEYIFYNLNKFNHFFK